MFPSPSSTTTRTIASYLPRSSSPSTTPRPARGSMTPTMANLAASVARLGRGFEVLAAPEVAAPAEAKEPAAEPEPVLIWRVPLVDDDERSDTALLKFLRAHQFKVKEAMAMLKAATLWRKRFDIEALLDADLRLAPPSSPLPAATSTAHLVCNHNISYHPKTEIAQAMATVSAILQDQMALLLVMRASAHIWYLERSNFVPRHQDAAELCR